MDAMYNPAYVPTGYGEASYTPYGQSVYFGKLSSFYKG
ncbi:unnamed protein product [Anisakis simplex]|uniref:Uncharacterized protein n=1 Tax=Anisakis simplex TaxID=6269 RepID=A0A0M3KKN8_ANISI|nr:unnamed protein product [Anisakis simplex]